MPYGKGTYGSKVGRPKKKKSKKKSKKKRKEEIMAKTVSWMWGGKRYKGTLIRETKTHKFARTHNGKIKKIKKK